MVVGVLGPRSVRIVPAGFRRGVHAKRYRMTCRWNRTFNYRFQLKTVKDSEEFSFIQMKIEDPKITKEYLMSDPGCISCVCEKNIEDCPYCLYDREFLKFLEAQETEKEADKLSKEE